MIKTALLNLISKTKQWECSVVQITYFKIVFVKYSPTTANIAQNRIQIISGLWQIN